jgi:hypothetical protein
MYGWAVIGARDRIAFGDGHIGKILHTNTRAGTKADGITRENNGRVAGRVAAMLNLKKCVEISTKSMITDMGTTTAKDMIAAKDMALGKD